MSQRNTLFLSIAVVAGLCGVTATAHAADPACKPVLDAMTKAAATSNHLYMTETAAYNAAPESGESITTAHIMYVKAAGKWHAIPYNAQQLVTEMRKDSETANIACQHLRDETVAGESVAVYNTQQKQAVGTMVNSQLWISKSRGLPVKQTTDMDVGGKRGKSHTDLRYDYSNVQVPAGAH